MTPTPASDDRDGINKILTGIQGFDQITDGGLPAGCTTLVVGAPGSGKTIFALQTLVNSARNWGEPGIFVAFEENSRRIMKNAATFGWDLQALEKEQLFFLDAHMSANIVPSGGFDLIGILASLEAKAREMGATRIVFDSIHVLLSLLDNPVAERTELYRIHDWLDASGMTGIITARVNAVSETSRTYDFMQYMADCVVELNHRIEQRDSLRSMRVVKYRGSSFAANEYPLIISSNGIVVSGTEFAEPEYPVFTERISTGVERLDNMLEGGYYRGSSILVTGSPGTAKSTLSAAFIEAACLRGERSIYLSFDEGANEVIRNMRSIGIELGTHVDSGVLRVHSQLAEQKNAEEHLIAIRDLIREHKPQCIVIDPLSAMLKSVGLNSTISVAQRLIRLIKSQGITLMCTSLVDDSISDEKSAIQVSTIADTWLYLSYVAQSGERNRALTIVKSRGTLHSNQVRELVLSKEGVTLSDVYIAGGNVLMGTLRFEKESAERQERVRLREERGRRRRVLELEGAELNARMEALRRELDAQQAALRDLAQEDQDREDAWNEELTNRRRMRGADKPNGSGEDKPLERP